MAEFDPVAHEAIVKRGWDNVDRIKYFDQFIDGILATTVQFDPAGHDQPAFEAAVGAYKETLEHQGIPLSPEA